MSQQFRIDSEALRDKINSLLPSQARGSINVDLTGTTTIVPIVDLTETAEGSSVRPDLQTALSFISQTSFSVNNTTSTIVNTTGYYRVFGTLTYRSGISATTKGEFIINDGTTDKTIWSYQQSSTTTITGADSVAFDFVVFLTAGDSLKCKGQNSLLFLQGSTRQIADLSGNLINP